MMKLASVMFAVMICLAGCEPAPDPVVVDQCLRRELFKTCMASLPKGPESTVASNDWDEVVAECGTQSYYQAKAKRENVKPECAL